uniref:Os08g0392700 protein n=1 Tax=Macrostomum lignano TaxID=282301 RepID=A0A1I8F8U5_9PLAT
RRGRQPIIIVNSGQQQDEMLEDAWLRRRHESRAVRRRQRRPQSMLQPLFDTAIRLRMQIIPCAGARTRRLSPRPSGWRLRACAADSRTAAEAAAAATVGLAGRSFQSDVRFGGGGATAIRWIYGETFSGSKHFSKFTSKRVHHQMLARPSR